MITTFRAQPIEVARILKTPEKIEDERKGINDTYYGSLTLQTNEEINAYIKHIPPNEVFTEAICSLICSALSLPTPKPYLALLDGKATLPSLKHGEDPLLFATIDAKRPSFKKIYAANELMYDMLVDWVHTPCSAVFDEQVANQDRNAGNILMDAAGDCSLIDHGLAFNPLVPANSIQSINTFANITAKRKDPLKQITHALPRLQYVDFDHLLACSQGNKYADTAHIEKIRTFYHTRLRHIRDIFDLRFGATSNMSLPI